MTRPASLQRTLTAHAGLCLLGLVSTVLVWLMRDDLVASWADGVAGRPDAIAAGDVSPPAFVPVAAVLVLVLVALIWVLCAFVRLGYAWARVSLAATLILIAVATVAGIRTDPPTTFVVVAVLSFAIEAVALHFLWHRDTTAWIRGTWHDERTDVPV